MNEQKKKRRQYLFSIIGCFALGLFFFVTVFTQETSIFVFVCYLVVICLSLAFVALYTFILILLSKNKDVKLS